MGLLVPAKARVRRSGGKYVLYIIDEADNEFLSGYLGRRVIAHIKDVGISVRVSLTLNKSFKVPRVMAYLPSACITQPGRGFMTRSTQYSSRLRNRPRQD